MQAAGILLGGHLELSGNGLTLCIQEMMGLKEGCVCMSVFWGVKNGDNRGFYLKTYASRSCDGDPQCLLLRHKQLPVIMTRDRDVTVTDRSTQKVPNTPISSTL